MQNNFLIPVHRKLAEEEVNSLLKKYNLISKLKLPKIKANDNAIAELGAQIGDVIEIKPNKTKKKIFDGIEERLSVANLPSWLTVDAKAKSGKVVSRPIDQDFDKIFDVKLITEYYSAR